MTRRALLPVAPALAAAYNLTTAEVLARPYDEACRLVAHLPAFVGRSVNTADVTFALEALHRLRVD